WPEVRAVTFAKCVNQLPGECCLAMGMLGVRERSATAIANRARRSTRNSAAEPGSTCRPPPAYNRGSSPEGYCIPRAGDSSAGLQAAEAKLPSPSSPSTPSVGPNPRVAIALLLLINLMNYVDRYVLAAVEVVIGSEFEKAGRPISDAKMGLLATAFLISY